MALIYLLTNKINGKQYVGKTFRKLEVRWSGHLGGARRGDNDMLVCRAIRKHGADAFERTVLKEIDGSELPVGTRELGEWEKHFIKELKTHVSQGGYNLTTGGDGGLPGYKFSEESKEKIRQKALGRKHTAETKAKISQKKSGVKQDPEHVAKRVATNTGKKRTEEQRARISEGLKGHLVSDEAREKLSIAGKGRITSEETKQKFFKAVDQLAQDGTLIIVHKSLTVAATVVGLSKGAMSGVVREQKLYGGYRWRYHEGA